MLFPANAFDSDDDRSQSSGGSDPPHSSGGGAPYSDDDDSSIASSVASSQSSDSGVRHRTTTSSSSTTSTVSNPSGLGRAEPLSRPGDPNNNNPVAAYSDSIYTSSSGSNPTSASSGIMNLRELDAYVQETVRAQRQQRRQETMTKLGLLLIAVAISATLLGSSLWVWNGQDQQKKHQQHSQSTTSSTTTTTQQALRKKKTALEPFGGDPPGYKMSQCEGELNMGRSFAEVIYDVEQLEQDYPLCREEV